MILLTPGPLTTSRATREAMLEDWGSRDPAFIALTAELRRRLLAVVQGEGSHVCVPIQGSGTFVVEAAIQTLIRPDEKLLVLANGVYGERLGRIAERLGREVEYLRWPESAPVEPAALETALRNDSAISHVAVVHCETTTGLLNPLAAVAGIVARAGRHLMVDAMSSFGAIDIDLRSLAAAAVLASSNKCLEGAPGIGFAIVDRELLSQRAANSASLSLDLHDQWRGFESNGQWRFTPPVQVVAAGVRALEQLEHEGGPRARLKRYQENLDTLLAGMQRLGIPLYLDRSLQAPIIATFRIPPGFPMSFQEFYDALAERGYLIYPGKLTGENTFRIGCIGAIGKHDFEALLRGIESILGEEMQ
jgi:2-aminoethylphosphonate-pyruvate transaminase